MGLSETEAEAQGIAYRLFKVPMETNLLARTLSETREFVKALVEADSDRILGFTAFSVGAGEILAAVQIAMIAGLPYTALRDAVLTPKRSREQLSIRDKSDPRNHCEFHWPGIRRPAFSFCAALLAQIKTAWRMVPLSHFFL
jgi:hypothetical protein